MPFRGFMSSCECVFKISNKQRADRFDVWFSRHYKLTCTVKFFLMLVNQSLAPGR
jgi:hypothetical protein